MTTHLSPLLERPSPMMERYEAAPLINPPDPDSLPPIYVSDTQSHDSLYNLAFTFCSSREFWRKRGIQLFEVPAGAPDLPYQYALKGYSAPNQLLPAVFNFLRASIIGEDEPSDIRQILRNNNWQELASKTDFSCKEGFKKIVLISDCACLLAWRDGTWLAQVTENFSSKKLHPHRTATPVYRFTSPNNYPKVRREYRSLSMSCRESREWWNPNEISIWIQPHKGEAPAPYSRFESMHMWAKPDHYYCSISPFEIPGRYYPPYYVGRNGTPDHQKVFYRLLNYQTLLKTHKRIFHLFLTILELAKLKKTPPKNPLKGFVSSPLFNLNVLGLVKQFLAPPFPSLEL